MTLKGDTGPDARSDGSSSGAALAARPKIDVVAITGADDFLVELGDVLAGRATVYPVYSTAEAIPRLWASHRGQILVIDCRQVSNVQESVDLVVQKAPHAAVLLFGPEEAQEVLASAFEGRPVLPLPLDWPSTEEVLQAAIEHAATHPPGLLVVGATPARPRLRPRLRIREAGHPVYWWAGLAGFFITAGMLWFVRPRVTPLPRHAPVAASLSPVASSSGAAAQPGEGLARGTQEELLQKAAQAMRQGRYAEPPEDSALLYFRSALAAGPANAGTRAEVRDGLARIANVLIARSQSALAEGRLTDAQKALVALKQVIPGDERLQAFEQQLAARQASQGAAPGAVGSVKTASPNPTAASRGEAEVALTRLAALATAAAAEGRLILPPETSAQAYVDQMRRLAPSSPLTLRARADLSAQLLRRAREAGGGIGSDRLLEAARESGAASAEIEAVRRELGRTPEAGSAPPSNPAQVTAVAGVAPVAPQATVSASTDTPKPAPVMPAGQAAAVGAAPVAAPSAASAAADTPAPPEPRKVHDSQPQFPAIALQHNLGGAVTVQFTIDAKGEPQDVRAVESSPAQVFDHAAVTAVKKWRYEQRTAPLDVIVVVEFPKPHP